MSETGWCEIAEQAQAILEKTPPGGRRATFRDIATDLLAREPKVTIAPETLRLSVGAYLFIREVEAEDRELAGLLRRLPPIAVRWLMAWYRRDAQAVREAMLAFGRGEVTVRGLRRAELSSRTGNEEGGWLARSAIEQQWMRGGAVEVDVVWPFDMKALAWYPDGKAKRPTGRESVIGDLVLGRPNLSLSAQRDFDTQLRARPEWREHLRARYSGSGQPTLRLSLFLIGEYADTSGERARVADAVLRALGAERFNALVALVLPASAKLADYTGLLDKAKSDRILVLQPRWRGGSDDGKPLKNKGRGTRGGAA